MAKKVFDNIQREIYSNSPIGRAYLEYNDAVGGEPFGYTSGMPVDVLDDIDNEYGGLIGLYKECVKQGKTWEELLKTDGKWDELPNE